MTTDQQYYQILELKAGASPKEIKQAYRHLAKQWHPDRYHGNSFLKEQAEAKFKQINEAYNFLRDYQRELDEKLDYYPNQTTPSIENPETYYDFGVISAEKGRISEAIAAFSAEIRCNPDHWQAYHYRALLRANLGMTFAAECDWQKVAEIKGRQEDKETGRRGDEGTRRQGDKETKEDGEIKQELREEIKTKAAINKQQSPSNKPKAKIGHPKWHCVQTLTQHSDRVTSVAIARDGRFLVSGSYDQTVKVWHLQTGQLIHNFDGHTQAVNCLSISRNGILVASGSSDHKIRLWNLATGKLVKTLGGWFNGHQDGISCLLLSFYHQKVISGSNDQTLKFWNLTTGKELGTLSGYVGKISALALSSDEKLFVSAGLKPTLRIRNTSDGKIIRSLPSNAGLLTVAFSPQSNLIAAGGCDRTIRIWDLNTGEQTHTLEGHQARISSLAFSPDQKTIISGSWDNTVKIWHLGTGKEINTLKGHTDKVLSVAISPDGEIIVSGSCDQTIKIWEME